VESDVSADFRKMEKELSRSVIRFLFLEGKHRSKIKERMHAVYGDSSPSMATAKNWFNEFQRGRTSVFDEPRPGAPKTATTEDNVTKLHDLVLADRRLKIREIAETVGMSYNCLYGVSLVLHSCQMVINKFLMSTELDLNNIVQQNFLHARDRVFKRKMSL